VKIRNHVSIWGANDGWGLDEAALHGGPVNCEGKRGRRLEMVNRGRMGGQVPKEHITRPMANGKVYKKPARRG